MTPKQVREAIMAAPGRVVELSFFGDVLEDAPTVRRLNFDPNRLALVDPNFDVVVPPAPPIPVDLEMRRKILRYEEELTKLPNLCAFPLRHFFTDGLYVRECYIAQGVAFVGHIHRYPCINILQYGVVEVASEAGIKTIAAPYVWESPAHSKRAGLALKDTCWTTIHANPTNERDPDRMERLLIVAEGYESEELSCHSESSDPS